MQIHTTDTPAKLLGEELSERINTHDGDVVCLLSGGSALDVIPYINVNESPQQSIGKHPQREYPERGPAESYSVAVTQEQNISESRSTETTSQNIVEPSSPYFECRTIFMMGDERGNREPEVNNTLQLEARHPDHLATKSLIPTIPNENESLEDFASRIEKTFLEKISQLKNVKIFMILGIGTDGHTAGIFPLPKESFQKVYRDDLTYVPVHVEGLTIDSRASLTPSWILDHVDEIFAYVVGQSKQRMLESLQNETKKLHERPAELLKLHKLSHIYTDLTLEPK